MYFLDLSKALDIVNLVKLAALEAFPQLDDLVRSFLDNCSLQFHIDDNISEDATVSSGVHQGSVIDPLLFKVMVS